MTETEAYLFTGVTVLFFVFTIIVSIYAHFKFKKLLSNAKRTVGEIIDTEESTVLKILKTKTPKVKFQSDSGGSIVFVDQTYKKPFNVGSSINIIYDSMNPNHATTKSMTFLKYYKFFVLAMGITVLIIGLWLPANYDLVIQKIQQFQQAI